MRDFIFFELVSFLKDSLTLFIIWPRLLVLIETLYLFSRAYISLKFQIFEPCRILHSYLAASSGFCPPCLIIEPPKKTVLQILKKDAV